MIFINKLYIVFIICIGYLLYASVNKEIIIPEESLRFRVIANSNELEDQSVKMKVKNNLEKILPNIIGNSSNIVDTKNNISNSIDLIRDNVRKTLDTEKAFYKFDISLGKNYFPEKEVYKVRYPEGEYESLVISLGEAKGDNWWCVLFPPLCLIEAEEQTEIEYKLYIKEVLNKYRQK